MSLDWILGVTRSRVKSECQIDSILSLRGDLAEECLKLEEEERSAEASISVSMVSLCLYSARSELRVITLPQAEFERLKDELQCLGTIVDNLNNLKGNIPGERERESHTSYV